MSQKELSYDQAVKKINTNKSRDNFMVISFGYSNKYVLPYKDGLTFLQSFASAEELKESYGSKDTTIKAVDRSNMTFSVLSAEEYEQIKVAALLGISPDELRTSLTSQSQSN